MNRQFPVVRSQESVLQDLGSLSNFRWAQGKIFLTTEN